MGTTVLSRLSECREGSAAVELDNGPIGRTVTRAVSPVLLRPLGRLLLLECSWTGTRGVVPWEARRYGCR